MSWNDGGVEGKKQKEEDSRNSASADVRRQYSIEFDSTDWKTPPPLPNHLGRIHLGGWIEGGSVPSPLRIPSEWLYTLRSGIETGMRES